MKSKLTFAIVLGCSLILASCGKELTEFVSDVTVNPSPLELVGDKVPATVTGTVLPKTFVKDCEVTVTPYLVYGDTETASASYTYQGEKVSGNNTVISYDEGGTVTIPVMFAYTPAMDQSELYLDVQVVQGSKTYSLDRIKVADGVISTPILASASNAESAITADAYERITPDEYSADILYLINETKVRKSEIESEGVTGFNDKLVAAQADDRIEVQGVNIASYASPDGTVEFNTKVAGGREDNAKKYLDEAFKENEITEFGELTADFTAEDWEGFQELVSASDIQDKDLILSVLKMYKDPEQREAEIRNLSSVFDQLAEEILPQLRRSHITASVNLIGRSDEEILAAYEEDPSQLSVEEILYAATLVDDNAKKLEIYKKATELYPEDYRTWNNLATCQLNAGDYDAAKKSITKAEALASDSKEVQLNKALIALAQDDLKTANVAIGKAGGIEGTNEALGLYYIKLGQYDEAVKAYGSTKSNNAAIAQIAVKDYSTAKSTLTAITDPDATTYYLLAVVGARTSDEDALLTNLKKSIDLDSAYADRAKTDIEFADYDITSVL